MTKWIVAAMAIVTLGLGGAALAKKQLGEDTGHTGGCNAACHVAGKPKKELQDKLKQHVDKCKPKGTCKSCHEGKPKGKTAC